MAAAAIQQHNSTVLENLQEGDLVEFPRGLYSHWAVYVGDGKVIHLTGVESDSRNATITSDSSFTICGVSYSKASVRCEDFLSVVGNSRAKKNNNKDRKMSPSNGPTIIRRAREMMGEIEYNALLSNCEHFASYCRYGQNQSDQADNAVKGCGLVTMILSLFGVYSWRNRRNRATART